MNTYEIARIAHEVNRAFCSATGDDSQLPWHEAAEWQKKSAVVGVEAVQSDPTITPEGLHESWSRAKTADGWVYGSVKDPVAKTHPCLVPYAELPAVQRVKDALFQAVVRGLL